MTAAGTPSFVSVDAQSFTGDATNLTVTTNSGAVALPVLAAQTRTSSVNRVPTALDDASLGYKAGDLWRFGSTEWRCDDATAGAAKWSKMTVSGLPGDVAGAQFAGGCLRLVTGYTGKLIDVTTTVSGAAKTTTIGQDANGKLDRAALSAAILAADAGTYARIAKVYNQISGQAGDMIASPAGPRVGVTRSSGLDEMSWGEDNGPAGLSLSGMNIPCNALNIALMGRFHSTNDGNGVQPSIVCFGDAGNGPAMVRVGMDGGFTGKSSRYDAYRGYSDAVPFSFNAQAGAHILSFADNTTYFSSGRDVLDSGKAGTGSAMTTASIGYVPGDGTKDSGLAYLQSATADMHLSGVVIWKQTPTPSTIGAMRAVIDVSLGYTPQVRGELVILGDSRTQGVNTGDGRSWPSYLTGAVARFNRHNFAVSGATTSNMLSALPQSLLQGRTGETKLAVIWIGINDGTSSVSTTVSNIRSMVTQLQAAGFIVAVVDEFVGKNSSNQALRSAIKSALMTGGVGADVEVDPFIPGMALSDQTNAVFWNANDNIHPSYDAARVLGSAISEQINRYIDQ